MPETLAKSAPIMKSSIKSPLISPMDPTEIPACEPGIQLKIVPFMLFPISFAEKEVGKLIEELCPNMN
jgi:hypothetical protein